MGLAFMILVFWMLSFKPAFLFSILTFIKRLFNSSLFSAVRVVSFALIADINFLTILETRSRESSIAALISFWGLCPFLVVSCLSFCLYMVFPLGVCVLISNSYKETSHIRLRPTQWSHFNHLFKALSPNNHILRYWRLGFQCTNLQGNATQWHGFSSDT